MLTKVTANALTIIHHRGRVHSSDFARYMWPTSKKASLTAAAYLGKLSARKLVRRQSDGSWAVTIRGIMEWEKWRQNPK